MGVLRINILPSLANAFLQTVPRPKSMEKAEQKKVFIHLHT